MKAFPKVNVLVDNDNVIESDSRDGMDLRDYFATHATTVDIERYVFKTTANYGSFSQSQIRTVEQAKYDYADAMMKARKT